jgi:hypothetical protein
MTDVNAIKVILKDVKTGTYILPYVDTSAIESEVSDLKTALDGKQDTLADNQLIYWVTYGTTTYEDVVSAYNSGKLVACNYDNKLYTLGKIDSGALYFRTATGKQGYSWISVASSTNKWSLGAGTFQTVSNLVNSTSTTASSDTNYYSAKKVDNLLSAKADSSNVYTKSESDSLLSAKADSSNVYTKSESDSLLSAKADSSNVYTKTEIDTKLSGLGGITYEEY